MNQQAVSRYFVHFNFIPFMIKFVCRNYLNWDTTWVAYSAWALVVFVHDGLPKLVQLSQTVANAPRWYICSFYCTCITLRRYSDWRNSIQMGFPRMSLIKVYILGQYIIQQSLIIFFLINRENRKHSSIVSTRGFGLPPCRLRIHF